MSKAECRKEDCVTFVSLQPMGGCCTEFIIGGGEPDGACGCLGDLTSCRCAARVADSLWHLERRLLLCLSTFRLRHSSLLPHRLVRCEPVNLTPSTSSNWLFGLDWNRSWQFIASDPAPRGRASDAALPLLNPRPLGLVLQFHFTRLCRRDTTCQTGGQDGAGDFGTGRSAVG